MERRKGKGKGDIMRKRKIINKQKTQEQRRQIVMQKNSVTEIAQIDKIIAHKSTKKKTKINRKQKRKREKKGKKK